MKYLKKRILFAVCCILLLGVRTSDVFAQFVFSSDEWQFGNVEQGVQLEYSFSMKNTGEQTYTVHAISTCGCITIKPSTRKIEPNNEKGFSVYFDTTDYQGDIEKFLILRSDSEKLKKVLFPIRGFIKIPEESAKTADERPKTLPPDQESESGTEGTQAHYYYMPGCKECNEFIEKTVPTWQKQLEKESRSFTLELHDISQPVIYERMMKELHTLHKTLEEVPLLIVQKNVLQGDREIRREGFQVIAGIDNTDGVGPVASDKDSKTVPEEGNVPVTDTKNNGESLTSPQKKPETPLQKLQKQLSIFTVILAGLIDGLNPCAFATIVFLISALQLAGKKRNDIFTIGLSFALAVFATYFLIGLGFFHALRVAVNFSWISRLIEWLLFAVLIGFAGLSMYDYTLIRKGKPENIVLQLPRQVKQRIHKTMRERTRMAGLLVSSLIMGALISIFELGCTGQIYFPTITYLVKTERAFAGYLMLVIYNFGFVFPLLVVFLLAYFGVASNALATGFRKHLGKVKLITTVLFILLAVALVAF